MELIRIIILFIWTFALYRCQKCTEPSGGKICCSGEVWNISFQSCQPCSIGFQGPNCSLTCPFPYYGKDCQSICLCSKSLCSHVDGCNTANKDLSMTQGSSQSRSRTSEDSSVTESSTARQNMERKVLPGKTSGVYKSVICLIAISGLLLLLYLGLHCYIKRLQQIHLSSATLAI
uniref:Multiple epidermal growth factor-like domains protein 10 n=1 Tax=Crassostrea virginica TaxID=6565 RepID=A0A8B8AU01_CRAVI|nr:multiple epidermal growth factor-like domains protein 10 [Crassostrea virginica]